MHRDSEGDVFFILDHCVGEAMLLEYPWRCSTFLYSEAAIDIDSGFSLMRVQKASNRRDAVSVTLLFCICGPRSVHWIDCIVLGLAQGMSVRVPGGSRARGC